MADPSEPKLFRSSAPEFAGYLISEDDHGSLVAWPAEPKGWARRTPYTGPKRALEEVPRVQAKRTGWPHAPRGPDPQGGEPMVSRGLRATDDQFAKWQRAARKRDQEWGDWARDRLNTAADRELAEDDPRPRGKGRS